MPDAGLLARRGTLSALDAVAWAAVWEVWGETLPLNPAVAPESTPDKSASLLADTAQAPKKMISRTVSSIAPMDVAMATFRFAYASIAQTFYYPADKPATSALTSKWQPYADPDRKTLSDKGIRLC